MRRTFLFFFLSCVIPVAAFFVYSPFGQDANVATTILNETFRIQKGATHESELQLSKDEPVLIEVIQELADGYLSIVDPTGAVHGPFSSPHKLFGTDLVLHSTAQSGKHKIRIKVDDNAQAVDDIQVSVKTLSDVATQPIYTLISKAQSLDFEVPENRKSALQLYKEAKTLLASDLNPSLIAHIYTSIAQLHFLEEKPTEAIPALRLAEDHYRRMRHQKGALWMTYQRAVMEMFLGNYESAREIHFQILSESKPNNLDWFTAITENYVGLTYFSQGRLEQAERWYEEALDSMKEMGLDHERSTTIYNLGWIQQRYGNLEQALDYFGQALVLDQQLGMLEEQVDDHVSMAFLYRAAGDCGTAIQLLNEALKLTNQSSTKRQLSRIYKRIAECRVTFGQYDAAENLLDDAARLSGEAEDYREQAPALKSLGEIKMRTGNLEAAAQLMLEAKVAYSKTDDVLGKISLLVSMANLELSRNRLDTAETYLSEIHRLQSEVFLGHRAADILRVESTISEKKGETLNAKAALERSRIIYARHRRAIDEIHTVHQLAKLNESLLPGSGTSLLDEGINLAETLRNRIASHDLRARYLSTVRDLYWSKTELAVNNYWSDQQEESAKKAFIYANQGQARTLLEQLDARLFSNEPPEVRKRRIQTRESMTAKYNALQKALEQETPDLSVVAKIESDIEKTQLKLNALNEMSLDTNAHVRKESESLEDIQSRLDPSSAILQFVLGEEYGLTWLITADEIKMGKLSNTEKLVSASKMLHKQMLERQPFDETAAQLSRMLFDVLPENNEIDSLYIIPDGVLTLIPFPALPTGSNGQLLIDRYRISLIDSPFLVRSTRAPTVESASVVSDAIFSKNDPRKKGQGAIARVSVTTPFSILRSGSLGRLVHSSSEELAITNRLADEKVSRLSGLSATKENLIRELERGPDLLHLATHGVFNPRYPPLSGLALSSESQSETAGFWSIREIADIENSPKLVVLSACETAVGEYIAGEGIMSMARAFIQNGATDVIASNWQVADRSTSVLMDNFYEFLLNDGLHPSDALRKAQQKLRQSRRWRHPFHWAGFSAWSMSQNNQP